MQLEITLLRMLSNRETWSKLRGAIPRSGLEDRTKQIAGRISEYYQAFPEVTRIEADPFLTWYFGTVRTNADAETKATWRTILERMQEPVDPALADGMFDKLLVLGSASLAGDVLARYVEGEDVDPIAELTRIVDRYKHNKRMRVETPVIDSNVLDLMDAAENHIGVKWRIPIMNEYIRPMAGGDFLGLAARPDRGKTSFLTDQGSYFAPQLADIFGPGHPLLWFCNEGSPRKIWLRMYSSIMNMTMTELGEFRQKVCKGNDTKFLDAIYEKIGGKENIVILDAHKMTNTEVEDIVAQYTPGIVIYDMIDNFHFAGMTMHGGTRTDQVLESMYQWARELCVQTNHIGIATSQISGEGEGNPFPPMSMLKDSKTGKQGTFDTLVMLGASNSEGMDNMRFISTPKNKLKVDGSPSLMKIECVFDNSRGRFNVGQESSFRPTASEMEDIPDTGGPAPVTAVRKGTPTKPSDDPLSD